jgi:hypothetical protein
MPIASADRPGNNSPNPIQTPSPESCGNLLAEITIVPATMNFLDCQKISTTETYFKARYRVSANNAANIESLLNRRFGMAKMRFVCCGWEVNGITGTGYYRRNSNIYQIRMFSEETLINSRSRWRNSNLSFIVTVERNSIDP